MRRALLLTVLAACGAHRPPGPASTAPVLATLERQGCYGECPIYTVIVYVDGVVQYDGHDFVKAKGRRTATLDAHGLDALRAAFDTAGFAQLGSYTAYDCTDLPTVILSYGGRTVEHYWGDAKGPDALFELEVAVDAVLETSAWVGPPGGPFGYTCF